MPFVDSATPLPRALPDARLFYSGASASERSPIQSAVAQRGAWRRAVLSLLGLFSNPAIFFFEVPASPFLSRLLFLAQASGSTRARLVV